MDNHSPLPTFGGLPARESPQLLSHCPTPPRHAFSRSCPPPVPPPPAPPRSPPAPFLSRSGPVRPGPVRHEPPRAAAAAAAARGAGPPPGRGAGAAPEPPAQPPAQRHQAGVPGVPVRGGPSRRVGVHRQRGLPPALPPRQQLHLDHHGSRGPGGHAVVPRVRPGAGPAVPFRRAVRVRGPRPRGAAPGALLRHLPPRGAAGAPQPAAPDHGERRRHGRTGLPGLVQRRQPPEPRASVLRREAGEAPGQPEHPELARGELSTRHQLLLAHRGPPRQGGGAAVREVRRGARPPLPLRLRGRVRGGGAGRRAAPRPLLRGGDPRPHRVQLPGAAGAVRVRPERHRRRLLGLLHPAGPCGGRREPRDPRPKAPRGPQGQGAPRPQSRARPHGRSLPPALPPRRDPAEQLLQQRFRADRHGEVGVAGPSAGAGLGRALRARRVQGGGGAGAPSARQGLLTAAAAALPPLPLAQERRQLRADGAAGRGRGGAAAARRLRGALPAAAAAGAGQPQQEALSGEPLRDPGPETPGPGRGDPPRAFGNKGCRDGACA